MIDTQLGRFIILPLVICVAGGFLFAGATKAALARILMGFGSAFAFIGMLMVATLVFKQKYFTFIPE